MNERGRNESWGELNLGLVPPAEAGQHLVVRWGVGLSHRGQQGRGVVLALGVVASRRMTLNSRSATG